MDLRKVNSVVKTMPLEITKAKFYIDEDDNDYGAELEDPVNVVENIRQDKIKQLFTVLGSVKTNDYWLDKIVYINFNYFKQADEEYEIVGEEYEAGGYFVENTYDDTLRTRNVIKAQIVKTNNDNRELFEMWKMFGVGPNIGFEDFIGFIKELVAISTTKVDVVRGQKICYYTDNIVSLNARDNFIKGIGLKEKDVATDIKQNGVIYYCDKKRKEEYFQLTNPISDRENKYASFADLVNAVHNEFLVQSGAKQKEKHKDVIESEYRIIE